MPGHAASPGSARLHPVLFCILLAQCPEWQEPGMGQQKSTGRNQSLHHANLHKLTIVRSNEGVKSDPGGFSFEERASLET